MLSKKVGDPCPKCASRLFRRRSNFRLVEGDVAYCGPCDAAYELREEEEAALSIPFAVLPA